jgi:hypothetical protein
MRKLALTALFGACIVAVPLLPAFAEPFAAQSSQSRPEGRPKVELDLLVMPSELSGKASLERHLRSVLRREARRANWGAGRGSKIEYRFYLNELSVLEEAGVLRVRCSAVGKLPRGKSAKSLLTFGGSPSRRDEVLRRVLEIVARGVITRLAELERQRRGGR